MYIWTKKKKKKKLKKKEEIKIGLDTQKNPKKFDLEFWQKSLQRSIKVAWHWIVVVLELELNWSNWTRFNPKTHSRLNLAVLLSIINRRDLDRKKAYPFPKSLLHECFPYWTTLEQTATCVLSRLYVLSFAALFWVGKNKKYSTAMYVCVLSEGAEY